jgi:hypothetical protein
MTSALIRPTSGADRDHTLVTSSGRGTITSTAQRFAYIAGTPLREKTP